MSSIPHSSYKFTDTTSRVFHSPEPATNGAGVDGAFRRARGTGAVVNPVSAEAEQSTLCGAEVSAEPALLNSITITQLSESLEKKYFVKCVKSGNQIELYEYKRLQVSISSGNKRTNFEKRNSEMSDRSKLYSFFRAKKKASRLIEANAGPSDKFVTLTFKEEVTDITSANSLFENFIKRLNRHTRTKTKYVCVPQIQEERAKKYGVSVWHYHVYFFGLGYIQNADLRRIWKHGFVRINAIDESTAVGSYVTRYMQKDFALNHTKGQRRFLSSAGLKEPEEGRRTKPLTDLELKKLEPFLEYEGEYFNNEQVGPVKYRRYNLRRKER